MKRTISILVAFALLGGSAWAKKVNFAELPEAVQKAIVDQKTGDEKALTVNQKTEQGKTVYKVSMKREGKDVRFTVASNGTVTQDKMAKTDNYSDNSKVYGINSRDNALNASLGKSEALRLGDAPVAVQNAIKAEVKDAENAVLHSTMKDGRPIYHAEIMEAGKNIKLSLAEDGAILSDSRKEGMTARLGLKKLALGELPPAAQNTIRSEAGTKEIGAIKTDEQNGKMVYKVEFKEAGKNSHVWVADNGSIVRDDRQARGTTLKESAGAETPPTPTAPIPTLGTRTERNLALTELPKPVQDTIALEQGSAPIKGTVINKKMKDGKTYYEVRFEKAGRDTKLHIGEDGALLPEKK